MCFSFGCDPQDVFDTETNPPKDRPTEQPSDRPADQLAEQLTVRRTERPSIINTVSRSVERFTEWDASYIKVIMFSFTDRSKGFLKNIVPCVPQNQILFFWLAYFFVYHTQILFR